MAPAGSRTTSAAQLPRSTSSRRRTAVRTRTDYRVLQDFAGRSSERAARTCDIPGESFSLFFTEASSSCLARGQMVPAGLYKTQEPAGQFANPVLLATVDRLRRDQFTAYAERYGPSEDEFGCVQLTHAA